MNTFPLHVVTPTAVFYEGEASCITLPLADGSIQFLARHAEELTTVTDGTAYYRTPTGDKVEFCTSGGVFYFDGGEAYLMVEHAAYQKDWDDKLQQRAEYLRGEQQRRRQSRREHMMSTVALNKAFADMHDTRKDADD